MIGSLTAFVPCLASMCPAKRDWYGSEIDRPRKYSRINAASIMQMNQHGVLSSGRDGRDVRCKSEDMGRGGAGGLSRSAVPIPLLLFH